MRPLVAVLATLTLAACSPAGPAPASRSAEPSIGVTRAERSAVDALLATWGRQEQAGSPVHPARWSYRATAVTPLTGRPGGALDVAASLTYRITSGGPDVVRIRRLTVSPSGGAWQVTAVAAPAPQQAVDLWDLGRVERRDGARCAVIGAPAQDRWVRWLAANCGGAARRVDAAVGAGLPPRTVLVVPADVAGLARLLARSDPAGLAGVAAETVGPRLRPAESVLLNPNALAKLRPVGRRVVLTHELVHVAMRAHATHELPTWLDEGLADEVAYRGTGLSPDAIAGPVMHAARAGRYPTAFPASGDFDAAGADPALAYARAWSAADTVVARAGVGGLVELTRSVGAGRPLGTALDDVLHVDAAGFLPLWRDHLKSLAARRASAMSER